MIFRQIALNISMMVGRKEALLLPNRQQLEKQERNFGRNLQFELERLQPEKTKRKEKLKRGKYYEVGDDGELVEVVDEIMRLEDNPKREVDNR